MIEPICDPVKKKLSVSDHILTIGRHAVYSHLILPANIKLPKSPLSSRGIHLAMRTLRAGNVVP